MTTNQVSEVSVHTPPAVLVYGVIPVHGHDIAVATVAKMLDGVTYGAQPVLVAPSTVYATAMVERMLRDWPPRMPRPWLVVVADVPAAPAPAARYRLRALTSRLAGIAHLPYLPVLRAVETPEDAIKHTEVVRAAAKLCRQMGGPK
jgi:hypothetical protein